MKICYNVEMSHIKDVVISHKVVYNKNKKDGYDLDEKRSKASVIGNDEVPKTMTGNEMAEFVRDYVGSKKWEIVLSSNTINIFKRKKSNKR